MESFVQIFEAVKEECQQQLSATAYDLWIKPIEPVSLENSVATLFLKSNFQKNIIVTKYSDMLIRAFKHLVGFEVRLEIITDEDTEEPEEEFDEINEKKEVREYPYTFDTFIVGPSNTFAYAACRAVAQNQSEAYNPLFIYGPSGLGKTHLLMAISHAIRAKDPRKKITYLNGETFTNELIAAIEERTTSQFREKYRYVDILLMDDVQFIAGKTQTQEEFFHTFNDLHQSGKQIVLTSDRPPKDIRTLEDRLRTRFEWGLIADIYPPDIETRIAIIRRKADLLKVDVPEEVAEYLAKNLRSNIRQLEGAVKKIKAYFLLSHTNPNLAHAKSVVKEILSDDKPIPVTINKIVAEVSRTFNVAEEDIFSSKRSSPVSIARQFSMYIVREITQIPYTEIGKQFNGRDHATVVYAIQKVENMLKKNIQQKEIIEDIIRNIRNN